MTERTSHLAGLWIGAAFSNTSHSNKLQLSNEHGSQVKEQGRRHCCHNKHKKFPHRLTRDVSLLSGQDSYKIHNQGKWFTSQIPIPSIKMIIFPSPQNLQTGYMANQASRTWLTSHLVSRRISDGGMKLSCHHHFVPSLSFQAYVFVINPSSRNKYQKLLLP